MQEPGATVLARQAVGDTRRKWMAALPNKHCSGHHGAVEKEGDQRISGNEIWRTNLKPCFTCIQGKTKRTVQNRDG